LDIFMRRVTKERGQMPNAKAREQEQSSPSKSVSES
jgi:hypothetical protein